MSRYYRRSILVQIAWHMLGAALAAAAPGVPAWQAGFEGGNNIGGLLSAILEPTGTFGKVLLGIVALTASCACAPTMYTFGSCSFTPAAPQFLFMLAPPLIPIKRFQGQASWLYLTSSRACHVIFFPSYLSQCKCPVTLLSFFDNFIFRDQTLAPVNHWREEILHRPRGYTQCVVPPLLHIHPNRLLPIRHNWLLVHSICSCSPDGAFRISGVLVLGVQYSPLGPSKAPSTGHRSYSNIPRRVRHHHTEHVADMVHRAYREGWKWRYRNVYGRHCCGKLIYTLEDTGEEDVAGKIICLGLSQVQSLGVKRNSLK